MIQSVGVIIAAFIIYFDKKYLIADPICTYIFSVIVMITTGPVSVDCFGILMEYGPKDVEIKEVKRDLLAIKGIQSIEDFHLWQLGGGKNCLTAHFKLDPRSEASNSRL